MLNQDSSTLIQQFQEILQKALLRDSDKTIGQFKTPKEVENLLPSESAFQKGHSQDDLMSIIDTYISESINTRHTHFMNQLWSGLSLTGYLGDSLAALTNTSIYTFEVAPLATLIEKQIINQCQKLTRFNYAEGTFVPGGSYANMLGLLLARNHGIPESKSKGCQTPVVIYCSKEAHYSILKASNILGVGEQSVCKVEVNKRGQMDIAILQQYIQEHKQEGKKPLAVVATCGTTVRGAFDSLEDISKITQKENIWLHADAALGGCFLFSNQHKHHLKGIEKVDSMTWNFHKMLGIPLHCSLFLSTHKNSLLKQCGLPKENCSYLFHEDNDYNLGEKSLLCGRRVDVLKIWLTWYKYGTQGLATFVEKFITLTKYGEKLIENNPYLEMVVPRNSICVCFRFTHPTVQDLNSLNKKIREALLQTGEVMINYGWFEDKIAVRLLPINKDLEKQHIQHIINLIANKGLELLEN